MKGRLSYDSRRRVGFRKRKASQSKAWSVARGEGAKTPSSCGVDEAGRWDNILIRGSDGEQNDGKKNSESPS